MKNKFNYFKEVKDTRVRYWNLAVTCFNINSDFGGAVLEDYLSGLNQDEMMLVSMVFSQILKEGVDKTRLAILKNVEYEEDLEEAVA